VSGCGKNAYPTRAEMRRRSERFRGCDAVQQTDKLLQGRHDPQIGDAKASAAPLPILI
jgi:hypothetical protein